MKLVDALAFDDWIVNIWYSEALSVNQGPSVAWVTNIKCAHSVLYFPQIFERLR